MRGNTANMGIGELRTDREAAAHLVERADLRRTSLREELRILRSASELNATNSSFLHLYFLML